MYSEIEIKLRLLLHLLWLYLFILLTFGHGEGVHRCSSLLLEVVKRSTTAKGILLTRLGLCRIELLQHPHAERILRFNFILFLRHPLRRNLCKQIVKSILTLFCNNLIVILVCEQVDFWRLVLLLERHLVLFLFFLCRPASHRRKITFTDEVHQINLPSTAFKVQIYLLFANFGVPVLVKRIEHICITILQVFLIVFEREPFHPVL